MIIILFLQDNYCRASSLTHAHKHAKLYHLPQATKTLSKSAVAAVVSTCTVALSHVSLLPVRPREEKLRANSIDLSVLIFVSVLFQVP
jgi:hypothetical protein